MTSYHSAELVIPFPNEREARIAHGTLSVDQEPKRGGVNRTVSVKNTNLIVHFKAEELRSLRVSVNSFMDYLLLVLQTIQKFRT